MLISFAAVVAVIADTSCNTTNDIVAENALKGSPSTHWDVNGAGSEEVQGFSTRLSVLPGARVKFKLKMAYDEELRIDIYRLGWYGGDGARKCLEGARAEDCAVGGRDDGLRRSLGVAARSRGACACRSRRRFRARHRDATVHRSLGATRYGHTPGM